MKRPLLLALASGVTACAVTACAAIEGRADLECAATPAPPTAPVDAGDGHGGAFVATSGSIVNACVPVVDASASSIQVADASGFAVGDRVLLLQVKDDLGVVGSLDSVSDPGAAGLWEIARVMESAVTTLSLAGPLANVYTSSGVSRAQVCSVPEFTTVEVPAGAAIRAEDWDGAAGGVVALYASVRLEIAGEVTAAGAGFRGGVVSSNGGYSDVEGDTVGIGRSGGRGEGIDGDGAGEHGRANRANAGGGGNAHNGGGGGGGNGGAGGQGGKQFRSSGNIPGTAGRGGSRIDGGTRLFFGGAGGGGHQNGSRGGEGGAGGGIVLLFAGEIGGAGTLSARGASVAPAGGVTAPGGDGGGGGGAGGTVLVLADSIPFSGLLDASGGDGGDALTTASDAEHGPGGGGGGGRVRARLPSAEISVAGGRPGANTNLPASPNPRWGATSGGLGRIEDP